MLRRWQRGTLPRCGIVVADDRQVLGHPQPEVLGGPDGVGGVDVGEAEQARRAVRSGEQHLRRVVRGGDRVGAGVGDERLHPCGGEGLAPAGSTLAGGTDPPVEVMPDRDDADPPVAELEEVLGPGPGAPGVVDVDRRDSLGRGLVDGDDRGAPLPQPVEVDAWVTHVDDRAVHRQVLAQWRVVTRRRDEGQGQRSFGQGVADGDEELGGHRVSERLAERVGEEQANGARPASRQGAGAGVGAAVPELGSGLEDGRAQRL